MRGFHSFYAAGKVYLILSYLAPEAARLLHDSVLSATQRERTQGLDCFYLSSEEPKQDVRLNCGIQKTLFEAETLADSDPRKESSGAKDLIVF